MHTYTLVKTTWGWFGFVSSDHRLVATYLPNEREAVLSKMRREWGDVPEDRSALPAFQRDVRAYFEGRKVEFDVMLDEGRVSDFRHRVLRACRAIESGSTASYGELARRAGRPGASRAVGTIMARNRMPIVIPCHRVVRSDGSLGGFSSPGGLDEKQRLLELERGAAAESPRVKNSSSRGRRPRTSSRRTRLIGAGA